MFRHVLKSVVVDIMLKIKIFRSYMFCKANPDEVKWKPRQHVALLATTEPTSQIG